MLGANFVSILDATRYFMYVIYVCNRMGILNAKMENKR
jgi:hypothetical protein